MRVIGPAVGRAWRRGTLAGAIPIWVAVTVGPALAQSDSDVQLVFGIDGVSNYVSNGVTQSSDRPAVQPYAELLVNGFYAGTWLSTVDFGAGDNWEIDLYAGYRRTIADKLLVDISYARYLYDDSGDCCGEARLTLAYPLWEGIGVTGYLAYDPVADNLNRRLTLAYDPNERFGLAGTYGYSDFYGHDYWTVGATWSINDTWSTGLSYHGSGSGDPGLVFRISMGNLQTPLARLLGPQFQR